MYSVRRCQKYQCLDPVLASVTIQGPSRARDLLTSISKHLTLTLVDTNSKLHYVYSDGNYILPSIYTMFSDLHSTSDIN